MTPNIPPKAPHEGHDMEKIVQWASKGTPRIPQNVPPPKERDMMSKINLVLVIIMVIPRATVQNFMTKYWTDI